MFDLPGIGKSLVVIGLILVGVGLVLTISDKIPWLGRLPGDFHYKGGNFSFYFPLATSLVVSVVLTLVLWFINRR
jgi:hypothetical protein